MTLEELTPSDEDKPYVTESEESEDTEEDVTDKEMRSNLKRKKFCKTIKKPTTTPKSTANKNAPKTKTSHDKNSTTSQQETPQCMLP